MSINTVITILQTQIGEVGKPRPGDGICSSGKAGRMFGILSNKEELKYNRA
jgi:hypothetical protein